MLVVEQLLVPIDFHSIYFLIMKVKGDQQLFGISKFFKILYFAFNNIKNKPIQVWNDMKGITELSKRLASFCEYNRMVTI